MSSVLYLDCVGGAAGDMLLGALLDAGAGEGRVRDGLAGLGVAGLGLDVGRTERHGIAAARVEIVAAPEHAHRRWADVRELIEAAELPERARARALGTFRRLAEAEGRIHDMPAEEVVFHEVGAIDALGDVCGVALALDALGVARVVASPLPAGRGLVGTAHGRLPLPAPATLELLRGAPVYGVEEERELVTPTGAALLAELAESFGPLPPMRLQRIGYGAGRADLASRPNVVRAVIGEELTSPAGEHPVTLLETNLDDLIPELIPDVAERCVAAGALDVWTVPAGMKKGRPGIVLSALARPADEDRVAAVLLRETSALGVRVHRLARRELERRVVEIDVDGGRVRVKLGLMDGEVVNVAPEHDDCAALAARAGRTVKDVWAEALSAARAHVAPVSA